MLQHPFKYDYYECWVNTVLTCVSNIALLKRNRVIFVLRHVYIIKFKRKKTYALYSPTCLHVKGKKDPSFACGGWGEKRKNAKNPRRVQKYFHNIPRKVFKWKHRENFIKPESNFPRQSFCWTRPPPCSPVQEFHCGREKMIASDMLLKTTTWEGHRGSTHPVSAKDVKEIALTNRIRFSAFLVLGCYV